MKAYTNVSRKTVGEDRVAICPIFGCEFISRVKPLKLGFLGFGKYPKCKKHRIPLVYIDERIKDFVDAALACLFDKSGLPPSELHESIKSKFPDEFNSFIEGWVYCITVGRGAPIVSHYMDTISNAYLKQLTKKQIKALKKGDDSKPNLVNKAIKEGMDEITIQYTRLLKHLRAHSEILIEHQKLKSLSKSLRNCLNDWQKNILKFNEIINSSENKREMALKETKFNYDQNLNVGICRCLLGLNPESKELKKAKITAFDRFSAYHEFYTEGLTVKFTKSDIRDLNSFNKEQSGFTKEEVEFLKNHKIEIKDLSSRWAWIDINPNLMENFFNEVIYPKFNYIPNAKDIREIGYRSFLRKFREYGGVWTEIKEKGRFALPKESVERLKATWRDFSEDEKSFFKRHKIFMKDLKSRWDWGRNNKELILIFFREVIYTKLGYIPNRQDIIDLGFRGIIRIIREMNLTFSNIISEAFKDANYIKQEKTTWKSFNSKEIDFFEKYGIQWEKLKSRWEWTTLYPSLIKEFFKEVIIPVKGRIPTLNEIKDMGYRGLIRVCYSDYDYYDLINDISNELYGKEYNFVRNIPIHKIDEIKDAVKNLTSKFITKKQYPRSINYLSAKLGVSWTTFFEHTNEYLVDNYGSKKGLELFSLMWPYQDMKIQKIGIKVHILINDLFTLFLKELGTDILGAPIKFYREPLIFSNRFHPDGLILLTSNNLSFLKSYHPFFNNIVKPDFKCIIFDYSIDSSKRNIKKKVLKYGREGILLVIISLRDRYLDGIRALPSDVKQYKENAKIIDYHFFKEVFSLSKNYSASFDNLIQLVCKEDLNGLNKLQKLPSSKRYTTLHLKKDIKNITSKSIIDYFR